MNKMNKMNKNWIELTSTHSKTWILSSCSHRQDLSADQLLNCATSNWGAVRLEAWNLMHGGYWLENMKCLVTPWIDISQYAPAAGNRPVCVIKKPQSIQTSQLSADLNLNSSLYSFFLILISIITPIQDEASSSLYLIGSYCHDSGCLCVMYFWS